MEHDTCHAVEHRQRNEYGYQYQSGSNDRYPYFVGGIDSCFVRVFTTFDMSGDILQNDDGIVHHHTDGDGERTEGDDVKRRVGYTQVDKRHDEGDRNSDTDDDRGAPSAQEEQYHQHDEEQGIKD